MKAPGSRQPMHPDDDDPFDLARFVDAQEETYPTAIRELQASAKRSHWIWFIFPQAAGLGSSAMSRRYAIRSRAEAKAYLAHPLLRSRLLECVEALLAAPGTTARQVMGSPDDLKLRSSMTLFAAISESGSPFHRVLDRYYDSQADPATERFLAEHDQAAP